MKPNRQEEALPDSLFETAVRWHARLREPEASDVERAAFARWLNADPRHGRAYAEAQQLWAAVGPPVATANAAFAVKAHACGGRAWSRRRPAPRLGLALAASMLLAIAVGAWWRQGGLDDLRSDFIADIGERRTAVLADGTELALNTDTALSVALTPEMRRVRLFRGEAHFAVAADAERPFVVDAGEAEVTVVGTAFNLRIEEGETVVSVLHGRVRAVHEEGGEPVVLSGGQQVAVSGRGIAAPHPFDAAETTAWRRGQTVFYRSPLGDVVEELNRYHRGWIVLADPGLRARKVTGVFDTGRPVAALDAIERILGIGSTRITDRLIVLH